jgi:predicted RNase H-like HicB family nuclease
LRCKVKSWGARAARCYAASASVYGDSIHNRIFKEGRTFVAHALELDASSCGGSKEKALKNLKEAVRLFLEGAEKMGTLDQILEEGGYSKRRKKIAGPKFISVQRVSLPLPLTYAKA